MVARGPCKSFLQGCLMPGTKRMRRSEHNTEALGGVSARPVREVGLRGRSNDWRSWWRRKSAPPSTWTSLRSKSGWLRFESSWTGRSCGELDVELQITERHGANGSIFRHDSNRLHGLREK